MSYFFPNDAAEQDRLDLQHEVWNLILGGKMVLAPLPEAPRLVLDVVSFLLRGSSSTSKPLWE